MAMWGGSAYRVSVSVCVFTHHTTAYHHWQQCRSHIRVPAPTTTVWCRSNEQNVAVAAGLKKKKNTYTATINVWTSSSYHLYEDWETGNYILYILTIRANVYLIFFSFQVNSRFAFVKYHLGNICFFLIYCAIDVRRQQEMIAIQFTMDNLSLPVAALIEECSSVLCSPGRFCVWKTWTWKIYK